jgi:hypothetical protein
MLHLKIMQKIFRDPKSRFRSAQQPQPAIGNAVSSIATLEQFATERHLVHL